MLKLVLRSTSGTSRVVLNARARRREFASLSSNCGRIAFGNFDFLFIVLIGARIAHSCASRFSGSSSRSRFAASSQYELCAWSLWCAWGLMPWAEWCRLVTVTCTSRWKAAKSPTRLSGRSSHFVFSCSCSCFRQHTLLHGKGPCLLWNANWEVNVYPELGFHFTSPGTSEQLVQWPSNRGKTC